MRIGYTTKPGAKQHIVAFWKVYGSDTDTDTETDPDTAAEHKKKSFFLRYYRVFNIEDTTIPESEYPVFDRPTEPAIQDKTTEDILLGYMTKYGIGLREGGSAYYTPSDDIVTMPKRKYFKTNAGYYSTWAHEVAHSTGIPSRLNRFQQAASFGDKEYSLEELVAEITAAMIGSACGYANEHTEDNSAAYVQIMG
jgi:antirestriction protein ArdC